MKPLYILLLQKKAVRTITFSGYNAHTSPIFKHLYIYLRNFVMLYIILTVSLCLKFIIIVTFCFSLFFYSYIK